METPAEVALNHLRVESDEGFIDCSCGWESNHPLEWSASQRRHQEDPAHPDPIDAEGAPDPEHVGNDGPWADHLAALMAEALAAEATAE